MIVHVKCHSCAPVLWHIVVNRLSQLLLLLILFIFLDFLVSVKVRQFRFDGLRREGQKCPIKNTDLTLKPLLMESAYKLIFKLLFRPTT